MDEIWITRDGTRITVSDMTEQHAKNALRMCIRQRRLSTLTPREAAFLKQRVQADMADEEREKLAEGRCISPVHCAEQGWGCCMNFENQ